MIKPPKPDPLAIAETLIQFTVLVQRIAEAGVAATQIEAAREACLREIECRHETYRVVFDRIFTERNNIVQGYFNMIDEGRAAGDRELILQAMSGLSRLVETSPFRDVEKVRKMLEGDGVIEV